VLSDRPVGEIDARGVFREDLGDIDALAESIGRVGLLSPVTVGAGGELVAGRRRIEAVKQLGWVTVPCWTAPEVTDRLARVLAIRDDDALRKRLTAVEQAEMYGELEAMYAAQAKARQQAARFTPATGARAAARARAGGGGEESSPPAVRAGDDSRSRVKAAVDVTGQRSFQRLEQIRELQAIARDDAEDPLVQQDAADALAELNHDGRVSPRWRRVKLNQAVTGLAAAAADPAGAGVVREAAGAGLRAVQAAAVQSPKAALKAAKDAVRAVGAAKAAQPLPGREPPDPRAPEKRAVRALAALLRRENGWWDRCDPRVFGGFADRAQWAVLTSYAAGVDRFARAAAAARPDQPARG
jgi:ParB family chromosome partitioning protein